MNRSPETGLEKEEQVAADPKTLDRARDELFSHINRCGVLQATEDDQKTWMDETIDYLGERYPELSEADLQGLYSVGIRFCKPAIRNAPPRPAPEPEQPAEEVAVSEAPGGSRQRIGFRVDGRPEPAGDTESQGREPVGSRPFVVFVTQGKRGWCALRTHGRWRPRSRDRTLRARLAPGALNRRIGVDDGQAPKTTAEGR